MNSELSSKSLQQDMEEFSDVFIASLNIPMGVNNINCNLNHSIYLWKKLVLLSYLVKHLMSLNGWFQISSQNLLKRNNKCHGGNVKYHAI